LQHGFYGQGKSGKVGEFYIPKSGKTEKVRESQGIQNYYGAKVNKDAEKNLELLHSHCVQQFKIFSARFACRLFVLSL